MLNKSLKGQIAFQYIILIAVIIVAVIIFYVFFLLNIKSTLRPQQDILQYSLSNVYGSNETIELISNINLQPNVTYNGSIKLI
ncbi:MAG: hypothetical protein QXU98_14445, partial [Candidatus Parvarchaeota archaeon]